MNARPLQPLRERIVALDVLRGFALFGILLVNMLDFSGSSLRLGTLGARGSALDQLADLGVAFFAVTKFYLLFSFLFGVGFAVQMRRAEADGRPLVGFYLRRLAVLFGIGLAHSILIWEGDILRLYALAGVGLLLARRLPTRLLLGLAAVIVIGGLVFFGAAGSTQGMSELMEADAVRLFMSGSYAELVMHRIGQPYIPDIQTPLVLAMFLLGLAVGRSGALDQPTGYQPFLRRWWKWALPVGLVGSALMIVGFADADSWLISIGVHIGAPALSFVYLCLVLLHADWLGWLAPVGQMALSNYLAQSLVCTTLFYGYGFGLYDQLAPTVTLLLCGVIFAAQAGISAAWMGAFRFGPMEWLWRSLTYGQAQPLRRSA